MAIGDLIARLAVSLTLETAAFEEGATIAEKRMAQSQKRFEALGKKMSGFGKTMSLAVTAPIVAFGVASVKAAAESQQALGQVDAALKSMGSAAGRTSEQLQGLATNLMHQSLYDDDEILRKVTANLLTFGNVAGDNFDRAQKAAVDLAARMGTDLQSATIMVGKALNDPAKGLSALRRVGIQFTEQQQDQIKSMAAAGNAAGAQAIMLKELERQFGGSAKAMRDANPAAALKNSFDDLQEEIGGRLLPILPRITEAITGVLDAFGKLSPQMQTAVIVGAGLAAALGPVLVGLGGLVQVAAPLAAGISTLFGVISAAIPAGTAFSGVLAGWAAGLGAALVPLLPFIAAAAGLAAAGYAIYQNWDKIAPQLEALWQTIKSTIGPPFMEIVDALKTGLTELWNGPFGTLMSAAGSALAAFGSRFMTVLGANLVDAIKTAAQVIGVAFHAIATGIQFVTAAFDGTFAKIAIRSVIAVYQGAKTWLQDKLGGVITWLAEKLGYAGDLFFKLYDRVVGHSYIPDMVDGIIAHMARLDGGMVGKAKSTTEQAAEHFQRLRALIDRLFPEAVASRDFRRDIADIGSDKTLTKDQKVELRRRRGLELAGVGLDPANDNVDIGASALDQGVQDVIDSIGDLGKKAGETTVRVAKSFKDMANETLSSLQNLASSIKGGGFLDILQGIVGLGIQLGSIGAFGKKIAANINASVPGRAVGGPVNAGRPYIVGERGPELYVPRNGGTIIPNNKLGGGGVVVNINARDAVLTHQVRQWVAEGVGIAINGGSQAAQSQMAYRGSRRLA